MAVSKQNPPQKISEATQKAAIKVAAGNKREGQTKEQTKLIEQGIQKGIAEYKKAQKAKAREADKTKKKQQKIKDQQAETHTISAEKINQPSNKLPWLLLGLSWLGFFFYVFANKLIS